ncbi:hypothetical protein BD779DRAFT_1455003, partial [Infundibulicybe gibba]
EIFLSWTGIDPRKLAMSRINSPANTILMTLEEDFCFRQFEIYLDKDVVSHWRDFCGGPLLMGVL